MAHLGELGHKADEHTESCSGEGWFPQAGTLTSKIVM